MQLTLVKSFTMVIVAMTSTAAAVEIDFYLGRDCHGANLGHASVHEVYHNYNAPTNTQSMVVSDNGLNREIVASDPAGCSGQTGTADEWRGNGCHNANAVSTWSCYSLHE